MKNFDVKFRVWDNYLKEWAPSIFVYAGNGDLYLYQITYNYPHMIELKGADKKRYIIQFFTGLQDENKKDIYEGDIVRGHYLMMGLLGPILYESKGPVELIGGSYCVNSKTVPRFNIFDLEEVAIIGNICENPDLLEVKNE